MRVKKYLILCIVVSVFYILFTLLNTNFIVSLFNLCNGQSCVDIVEYIRIISVSFIVILPIIITGPLFNLFNKTILVYFCLLILILIFGDLHTSGLNFNVEYMVEMLSICFSFFLFSFLIITHVYMITRSGLMKYVEEFKIKLNLFDLTVWSIFIILTSFYLVNSGDMSYYCYKGDCYKFYTLSLFELFSFCLVASLPIINKYKRHDDIIKKPILIEDPSDINIKLIKRKR